MRILLWTEFFFPIVGGSERSAEMLLRELCTRGHQFMIVTTRYEESLPEEELWHGILLYRFPFASVLAQGDLPSWLRQQKELTRLISAFNPDLVHLFGVGANVLALLQILKQRSLPLLVRLISTLNNPQRDYGADSILSKTLAAATWVTAVSQAVRNQAVHYLPWLEARSSLSYNGHPPSLLEPAPLANPPRILFLGRLVDQKGCDFAIAAFAKLHQRFPTARLIIAGDGFERAQLEQQAAGLGRAVEFLGRFPPDYVHELINTATLMLIPSRWEGLPNVAIEAAHMARPIVATAIPGMSEVVLDGKTGILVEPGNVQALAAAMAYLLDHPDQANEMGMAARAWAQRQFTMARCAAEYEGLYPHVVAKHKRSIQSSILASGHESGQVLAPASKPHPQSGE